MNVSLEKYCGKRICVAVSGGKDSMALLDYLSSNAKKFNITLSALNCDHAIRGESSKRDSAFVKEECERLSVPLISFYWETAEKRTEAAARLWRISCYKKALTPQTLADGKIWQGADAIATAHHANDNAETVLFNLARGAALSGLRGITDTVIEFDGGEKLSLIRPLIYCSRGDIDRYINEKGIKFVTDESNLTNDYTRNKIRHNVLPELEKAVGGAIKSISRFSRLASEDEEYFARQVEKLLSKGAPYGYRILHCEERVVFKRAATKIITDYNLKDYTGEQLERLYNLQFAENGKKFEFLGLTAYKEEGKISICKSHMTESNEELAFWDFVLGKTVRICEQPLTVISGESAEVSAKNLKVLRFDLNSVPQNATVRFARAGDKFTKFGGGTKSLGDFFTDKKIPRMLRGNIPVIAVNNEILCVCGVEISSRIKITEATKNIGCVICLDYTAQN